MRPHRKPLTWLLAVSGLCGLPSLGSGCITSEAEAVSARTSLSGSSVSGTEAFIDELAPYGQWLALPNVGLVWQPSPSVVGPDFVPYATGGQWVHSDEGWTFVSQWDWGWAPFHYGRWFLSSEYGWVWVPGTDWAPAWVDWRSGNGHIGWAPLPPPGLAVEPAWTFVSERDFIQPNVYIYRLPRERAQRAYHHASPIRDRGSRSGGHWNQGPAPSRVHEATGVSVPRTTLRPPRPGEAPQPPSGQVHGSSSPPETPSHPATPIQESPRPWQREAPPSAPPSHAATPITEPPRPEPLQPPPVALPPPPTVVPATPPSPAEPPTHAATPIGAPPPAPAEPPKTHAATPVRK